MQGSRPLVAVVDDEEPVRKALKRLLRSAGMDVQAYAGGEEFLDGVAEQPPDCLVLDIRMPHMSGYDVQARLNAMPLALPIIFVTALDEPGDQATAMNSGAFAFLRKPFSDEALLDRIAAAIAHQVPVTGPPTSPPKE